MSLNLLTTEQGSFGFSCVEISWKREITIVAKRCIFGASESKFLYFILNINYVTWCAEKIITEGYKMR